MSRLTDIVLEEAERIAAEEFNCSFHNLVAAERSTILSRAEKVVQERLDKYKEEFLQRRQAPVLVTTTPCKKVFSSYLKRRTSANRFRSRRRD